MNKGRQYPQLRNKALSLDAVDNRYLALAYTHVGEIFSSDDGTITLDLAGPSDAVVDLVTAAVSYTFDGTCTTGTYHLVLRHSINMPEQWGTWDMTLTLSSGGSAVSTWNNELSPGIAYRPGMFLPPDITTFTAPLGLPWTVEINARPYELVPPYWPYG